MNKVHLFRVSIGFSVFIVIGIIYHYQHDLSDAISLRFKGSRIGSSSTEEHTNQGGYVIGWDFLGRDRHVLQEIYWVFFIGRPPLSLQW